MSTSALVVILVALSAAMIPTSVIEAAPKRCNLTWLQCNLDCQNCIGGGHCYDTYDCIKCSCTVQLLASCQQWQYSATPRKNSQMCKLNVKLWRWWGCNSYEIMTLPIVERLPCWKDDRQLGLKTCATAVPA